MSQQAGTHFEHLGPFSDLVAAARSLGPLFPKPASPAEVRRSAREVLHFTVGDEQPGDVQVGRRWEAGGVAGEEVSWSVGYGPRTQAWVLKPSAAKAPLAGVVALHCHGHNKILGKEKIADGPDGPAAGLGAYRDGYYGSRAYANALAREGFVVLVHDTFLWSSRRFPLEVMPERELALADTIGATLDQEAAGREVVRYNGAAYLHEHLVEKYCTVLGTSFAAIVAYEDRVAFNYLRSRPDVDAERLGCVGLSGGGARAALLRATVDDFVACAIAGMMNTYDGLSIIAWRRTPGCSSPSAGAGTATGPTLPRAARRRRSSSSTCSTMPSSPSSACATPMRAWPQPMRRPAPLTDMSANSTPAPIASTCRCRKPPSPGSAEARATELSRSGGSRKGKDGHRALRNGRDAT